MKRDHAAEESAIKRCEEAVRQSGCLLVGWTASRCFLMSLSGKTSPELVAVARPYSDSERAHVKTLSPAQRGIWLTERRAATEDQLLVILQRLLTAGFNARKNGDQIYVTL